MVEIGPAVNPRSYYSIRWQRLAVAAPLPRCRPFLADQYKPPEYGRQEWSQDRASDWAVNWQNKRGEFFEFIDRGKDLNVK